MIVAAVRRGPRGIHQPSARLVPPVRGDRYAGPVHPAPPSPLPLHGFGCFDPALLRAAVTTRAGGVSQGRFASLNLGFHVGDDDEAVLTNRLRATAAFGVALEDCVFAEQVAGAEVALVGDADRGRGARQRATAIDGTDALVTTDPAVTLAMMAADCMLIVLHDPAAGVLAVAHAGWPGATAGIIGRAVAAMVSRGADPARIVAGIGPTVSAETYQVGDDVAAAARAALGDRAASVLKADGTGRYMFDLVGAARLQLVDAGLAPEHVHTSGVTTGPGTPFYSHRFEGPTGRFAVLARLAERAAA